MYDVRSAMQAGGPTHPRKVTLDDADGVAALLARTDIKGAGEWRKYIGKMDLKIKLKYKSVMIRDTSTVTLFVYLNARVQSMEILDGKPTIQLTDRYQPQTDWPEIRALVVDKSWLEKSEIKVKVKRLSGTDEVITVPISHR